MQVKSHAELNALMAEHLLGWRWMKFLPTGMPTALTGIFPPQLPNQVFPNGTYGEWEPSDSTQPRFKNWNVGVPLCSTSWDVMGILLDHFTGFELFKQHDDAGGWVVWLFVTEDKTTEPGFRGCQKKATLAFCEAALKSKGIEIEIKF